MIGWLRRAPPKAAPTARARAPAPDPVIAPRTITVAGQALPLVIRRLAQARQMTLRLSPDGTEVRISIPRWGRVGDAETFARERHDWLAAQLARAPHPVAIVPGMDLPYRGGMLSVEWRPDAPRRPVPGEATLVIGGPAESLEPRLRRWLEGETLRLAAADLGYYCARAGQPVPRLALSRARRRWGSCAADGSIRINWRLAMAPDFVRRSVVAHEVAHLTHFDHSPAFHAHLATLYEGPVTEADRWLKRNGRSLYRLFA